MAKRSTERLVLLLLDRTRALLRVQVLAEGTEHRVCFKNRMFMSTVRAAHAKYRECTRDREVFGPPF